MKRLLCSPSLPPSLLATALLLFRCSIAGMMLIGHGWPKVRKFDEMKSSFSVPAPFAGFMNSTTSLGFAIFAEVVCCGLIIVGLATRFSALVLSIVMAVAAFVIQREHNVFYSPGMKDGFQELAILYLMASVFILLCGPGRISLDAKITIEKRRMFR